MKRITAALLIVSAALMAAGEGVQKTQTTAVEAEGYGATENGALYDALSNAVSKAGGLSIEPKFTPRSGADYSRPQIERRFNGYIKTYEIIDSGQQKVQFTGKVERRKSRLEGRAELEIQEEKAGELEVDGQLDDESSKSRYVMRFFVKVRAEVYQYKPAFEEPKDKRVRIVVMPFDSAAGSKDYADKLQSRLIAKLSKTNNFNVLDRQNAEDFAQERNIWLSADADIEEKARLANVLGADMMISGSLEKHEYQDAVRNQSSRRLKLYKLESELSCSLISVPERSVKLSDNLDITLTPSQINDLIPRDVPTDLEMDFEEVNSSVANMTAEKIAAKISSYVYPPMVAKVSGEDIFVNQGKGVLRDTDVLKVYSSGEEVKDPQTKLSLGSADKPIALLEVVEPMESLTRCRVVRGEAGDIEKGFRCRKLEQSRKNRKQIQPRTIKNDLAKQSSGVQQDKMLKADVSIEPKTIAVLPPRVFSDKYRLYDTLIPSDIMASRFSSSLTSALSKTQRFQVLDRAYEREYDREIDLLMKRSTVDQIMGAVDSVEGADYLLAGSITNFYLKKENIEIQAAGMDYDKYSAFFRYEYRIIELKTRKIKFADSMDIAWDDRSVKDVVPGLTYSDQRDLAENKAIGSLLGSAASKVCSKFIDQLYPIQVVGLGSDRAAVNAGEAVLAPGTELKVYSRGEEMTDPYSGKSLGAFEKPAGTIYIDKVNAKVSYGKITQGDIAVGNICRPLKDHRYIHHKRPPRGRKPNVEKSSSGGVRLPFDN
ncbi:CsgG/HfaB family protein [Sedimentisphaera salicampi]|uniref:CsgG/HfaB family protein n=1 Tax=Sedimentisphaera salicampi TaxID=1941349 RepID=UPI000B9A72A1|nr:CsgG/HfaB family protein [Sedimentisphaera salicampi]OXU14425.1 Curli production assembly/transport component CsgG [Sedimentisphaera salicampi]